MLDIDVLNGTVPRILEIDLDGTLLRVKKDRIGFFFHFPLLLSDRCSTEDVLRIGEGWDSTQDYYVAYGFTINGIEVPLKYLRAVFRPVASRLGYVKWQNCERYYFYYRVRVSKLYIAYLSLTE